MPFEYDIFLGGPSDRHAPMPYRAQIKAAFPALRIYDWEDYKGDDYQAHNDAILAQSLMMVSLVPGFPMPGIGPELGYFYRCHEERIVRGREGLFIGYEDGKTKNADLAISNLKIKRTIPVHYVILIWPDEVNPDFTKKTIGHYGLIIPTIEEAIAIMKSNFKSIEEFNDYETACEVERYRIVQKSARVYEERQRGGLRFRRNKSPWERG
ncbi:MAG: hypothetical protein WC473_03550 [Patescibacteria group bacterium]|jgi:hypothetical protein